MTKIPSVEEEKESLKIVAEFIEKWNKQDEDRKVAQAIETLLLLNKI